MKSERPRHEPESGDDGTDLEPAVLTEDRAALRWLLPQAGWAATFDLAGIGLRYILVLLIARLFGAAGLGIYTLAFAFASAAALAGRLGMDRASMRFIAFHRARGEAAAVVGVARFGTLMTIGLSGAVTAGLMLAAPSIERLWGQPGLGPAVQVMALAIPAIALGEVWRDALRGFQDIRLAALLEKVGLPALTVVFLLVGLLLGVSGPVAAIGGSVVAHLAAAVVAGVQLRRRLRPTPTPAEFHRTDWVRFAALMSLEGGLFFLLQWTDQLLIGIYLDAQQVGIYATALRLALLTAIPLLAVNMIMGPTAASLHGAGDTRRLRATFSRLTWATGAVGLVVGVAVIAVGPFLLGLFGTEFSAGYPALAVLVVGQIVNAATGSGGVILGMTGHAGWRFVNAGLTAATSVALNVLLIPQFGIVGSAVATTVSLVSINLLQTIQVRWLLGFWPYDPKELAYWFHALRGYQRRLLTGR